MTVHSTVHSGSLRSVECELSSTSFTCTSLNISWVAGCLAGRCLWATGKIGKPIWLVSVLHVGAGCRFAGGRLDGNFAPCCRGIARDAVVGQAKNRSPVHLLAHFRTHPHEMFRLGRSSHLLSLRYRGNRIAA